MIVPILAAACALLAGALIIYHVRVRKMISGMDKILDRAISGDFEPSSFDESQVSKLEAKLSRYISQARLNRSHLEEGKSQIHELISDISHQTKIPLSNILLYCQLLEERPELSDETRELSAQINAAAGKLRFLISSLVKSSRLETGIVQTNPVLGDVHELCLEAAGDLWGKAKAKGITLTVIPPEGALKAKFDPKWTAEAIYNIVDNAIKYTPGGGSVTLSLVEYEMFACLRIADTGRGIQEDDLPKIFGRFYRAADSAWDEGVGIGLYLAREIVQQCGGYISVSPAPDGGSVFSVFLSKL